MSSVHSPAAATPGAPRRHLLPEWPFSDPSAPPATTQGQVLGPRQDTHPCVSRAPSSMAQSSMKLPLETHSTIWQKHSSALRKHSWCSVSSSLGLAFSRCVPPGPSLRPWVCPSLPSQGSKGHSSRLKQQTFTPHSPGGWGLRSGRWGCVSDGGPAAGRTQTAVCWLCACTVESEQVWCLCHQPPSPRPPLTFTTSAKVPSPNIATRGWGFNTGIRDNLSPSQVTLSPVGLVCLANPKASWDLIFCIWPSTQQALGMARGVWGDVTSTVYLAKECPSGVLPPHPLYPSSCGRWWNSAVDRAQSLGHCLESHPARNAHSGPYLLSPLRHARPCS